MSNKREIDALIIIMCQPWIGCWLLAVGWSDRNYRTPISNL